MLVSFFTLNLVPCAKSITGQADQVLSQSPVKWVKC